MRDRCAGENHSAAFAVINKESDVWERSVYIGNFPGWSGKFSCCSCWRMQSISLQIKPLPALLLIVPSAEPLLQMPVLHLLPKGTIFSTLLRTLLSSCPQTCLFVWSHQVQVWGWRTTHHLLAELGSPILHPNPPVLIFSTCTYAKIRTDANCCLPPWILRAMQ